MIRANLALFFAALTVASVWSGPARAEGDAVAGANKAIACQTCHNADGNSSISLYPKLAGQNEVYLSKHIAAFIHGDRTDMGMQPMVENLSDQDVADLAAYYATQKVQTGRANPELAELGADLYRGGVLDRGVPACMACHGPGGEGNSAAGWPALAGQHADYVVKQLKDYRSGARAMDPNSMMRDVAAMLTEQEIDAVAQYISGLH